MSGVNIPIGVARTLLDIATESLDWGSGFLDDEEVAALRAFAELIGADPWAATPMNHRPKYCPGHVWDHPSGRGYRDCTICQFRRWRGNA